MALQTSGAISLNDIHLELGASSGTQVSLNDSDVRGLVNDPSGTITINQFYGASNVVDTQTVTVGSKTIYYGLWTGYHSGNSFGSISDGTCNFKSGASIYGLYWIQNSQRLYFEIWGSHTNSGFTSMTLNGVTYQRSAANFGTSLGRSFWYWSSLSSNPFGATSGTRVATWA